MLLRNDKAPRFLGESNVSSWKLVFFFWGKIRAKFPKAAENFNDQSKAEELWDVPRGCELNKSHSSMTHSYLICYWKWIVLRFGLTLFVVMSSVPALSYGYQSLPYSKPRIDLSARNCQRRHNWWGISQSASKLAWALKIHDCKT